MDAKKEIIIASFDVDAQQGFTPLCPNELPVPNGHFIAEALNGNFEYASYRVGSKDLHPANAQWHTDAEHAILSPVKDNPNVDVYWPAHCLSGSRGAELLPGLPDPIDYHYFVYKGCEHNCHPYGACYRDLGSSKSTGVIEWLKSKNVTEVIVGGLATDYCVRNTARQLADAGFTVIVNLASCRAITDAGARETIQYFAEWRTIGSLDIWAITDILDYRYQSFRNPDYVPQISS